jgi:hypothetical protein
MRKTERDSSYNSLSSLAVLDEEEDTEKWMRRTASSPAFSSLLGNDDHRIEVLSSLSFESSRSWHGVPQ